MYVCIISMIIWFDCRVVGRPIPGPNGTNATAEPHNFDHPWFQTVIMFMGNYPRKAYYLYM